MQIGSLPTAPDDGTAATASADGSVTASAPDDRHYSWSVVLGLF